MVEAIQRLPLEMLAEILGYVSVPEVLRSKQVNRNFRDATLASPLLQHKIDLFSTGLEYNAAAGVSLDDSRKALLRYCSSLDSLRPVEEKMMDRKWPEYVELEKPVGGVYPIVNGSSIRLFTMGSASRGIPHKEWEIPLPVVDLACYGFYPGADVIAFVELREPKTFQIEIHLRTLSDGGFHPSARHPAIRSSRRGVSVYNIISAPITSSRLAVSVNVHGGTCLIVWDWKTAQVLFEREMGRCGTVEFIDEYRLLANAEDGYGSPPSLVVTDTRKDVGGAPMRTLFRLPLSFSGASLLLERGVHQPSPAETLTPFHQDPAQRIIALAVPFTSYYLIFQVGAFLKFLETREGSVIGWDEWRNRVVIPSIGYDRGSHMEVYDFSLQGRAKYLSEQVNEILGGVKYLSSTGVRVRVPCDGILNVRSGHESTVFSYWLRGRDDSEGKWVLHIWTF